MKKLLKFVFMLLAVFGITTAATACNDQPAEPTPVVDQNQTVVEKVANDFTLSVSKVSGNFTLPTTAKGGVTISWASDSTNVVISGQNATVSRPAFADGDKIVTLTATFTLGEATVTKTYTITVEKAEDVAQIDALTVAEAIAAEVGSTITVRGIVSGYHIGSQQYPDSKQGFYITDATGTIYVFGYQLAAEVTIGDDVVVSAVKDEYKNSPQIKTPNLVQTVSQGNAIPRDAADTTTTIATIAGNTTAGAYNGKTFIFTNAQISKYTGSDYVSYTLVDASGNALNLYSGGNGSEFAVYDKYIGQNLTVFYVVNGQNSAGTKWRGHILEIISAEEIQAQPEPTEHVSTTIAALAASKPTESGAVIYEVTGIWTMDAGGETYGNGVLKDAEGNSLTIYGFCATNSVVSWDKVAYVFNNNKSYASMNIYSGATVKVGMVYTAAHDNYSIYLIELVENGTAPEPGTGDGDGDDSGNTGNPNTGSYELFATVSFKDKASRTEQDAQHQTWTFDGIVLTNNKDKSTTNVADYANPARFYKNSQVVITSTTAFTKLVVDSPVYSDNNYAQNLASSLANVAGVTVTVENTKVTIVFAEATTEFTFSCTAGQCRAYSIEFYGPAAE